MANAFVFRWCGLEWTIDPDGRQLEKLGKGTVQKMNCSRALDDKALDANAANVSRATLDDSFSDYGTSGSSITFYDGPLIEKRDVPAADPTSFSTSDFNDASCYNTGHTWTSEWMVKGADKFCYWSPGVEVPAGGYLNYTHHVCANGKDFRQVCNVYTAGCTLYTLTRFSGSPSKIQTLSRTRSLTLRVSAIQSRDTT